MQPPLGNLHGLRDRLEGRLNELVSFSGMAGYQSKV